MRKIWFVLVPALMLAAAPARAETWVRAAAVSAQEAVEVDKDSVAKDGALTVFDWRLTQSDDVISQMRVDCRQDFTAAQVAIETRQISPVPPPELGEFAAATPAPTALPAQAARFACGK